MGLSKEKLAYLAGFIDGEGYLGIKKYDRNPHKGWSPTYSERISVAGVNEASIRVFDEVIQGYIYFHKGSKLSNKGYWSWEVTEDKARQFLQKIYPYLRVKKPEADILLQLSANKKANKGISGVSLENRQLRDDLWMQVKRLHNYKETVNA